MKPISGNSKTGTWAGRSGQALAQAAQELLESSSLEVLNNHGEVVLSNTV